MKGLHFHCNRFEEVYALVERFHYSRRVPSNVQFVGSLHSDGGLFGDMGPCQAGIVFSIPPTRWTENVLELSRLVRRDDCTVPLTILISKACREIKKRRLIDLLVSYADWTQRHHGGIYRAASWNYDGLRKNGMDGVMLNGEFVPGRSANSRWGTRSPARLAESGIQVEPHYDDGKHLYWRALTRDGMAKAQRLGLKNMNWKPVLEQA